MSVLCMQAYLQTVTVTNNLGATVDASIRCGSSDRYTVSPTAFSLKPGHSCSVEVSLRVLRFAQKKKAVEQGQKDVFHIKVCTNGMVLSSQSDQNSGPCTSAYPLAWKKAPAPPSCYIVLHLVITDL